MYNHPATSQQLSQAYSSITNNISNSSNKIENSIKSNFNLNKSLFDRNLKELKGFSNYNTTRVLSELALFKEEIQKTLEALAVAQHRTNVTLLDIKKLLKNNNFEESVIKIRETGTNTPELELSTVGSQSVDLFPDKNNIKVFIDNNNGKNVRNTAKDDSTICYSS